ncbi:hypothetical protein [Planomonospora algeriensis]
MNLSARPLPDGTLTELAAGGGGAAAVRALREAQRAKTMLLVRGVVEEAAETRHPHAGLAADAYDLLVEAEGRAADAVGRVLTHPAAGGVGVADLPVAAAQGRSGGPGQAGERWPRPPRSARGHRARSGSPSPTGASCCRPWDCSPPPPGRGR